MLTEKIQKNIEKQYDIITSQVSTTSGLKIMTTTNQSTGKTKSLINNLMNNDSDGHTTFIEVG